MKLLPNEVKILSSNSEKVILTDHRVQLTDIVAGGSFTISIFLEDISSIETRYKSNIWLLILGGISVLGGLLIPGRYGGNHLGPGLVVGLIFFVIWWFTRKHIVAISSNGGSALNFIAEGMSAETINDFVYNVSVAKQKRVNALHKV
jgi:hypothetical protein